MASPASIAPVLVVPIDDADAQSRLDFESRWTAWKARGRAHERIVRRRGGLVLVAVAIGAIVSLFLIR